MGMSAAEDLLQLTAAGGSFALLFVGLLSIFDIEPSVSILHGLTQSGLLVFGGFLCLQGETRLFYGVHETVQENFGFALKPSGRAVAYVISGLYCLGARAVILHEGGSYSTTVGLLWRLCCFLMLASGVASAWQWHSQRRLAVLSANASDVDAYYISA
mmetsp:Transcript_3979/g.11090  ORF Transcript_3979/g.11090 Transcript_3979/m.11090 type:complete len:158 (-) Transcript_3979:243-716(-)